MGILENLKSNFSNFNFGRKRETVHLAVNTAPQPAMRAVGKRALKRVKPEKLELIYVLDSVVFQNLQRYANKAVDVGYNLLGDPNDVKYIHEWAESVDFDIWLHDMVVHALLFGNGWLELVHNKAMTEIVDMVKIDPKTMDFQRDMDDRIIYDKLNKPVGYIQNKGQVNEVKFEFWRLAHFKIYGVSDDEMGIGIIEPLFKTILMQLNLEQAVGQWAWRHAFPIFKAKVGNNRHKATPSDIDEVSKMLVNLSYASELVVPEYVDLDQFPPAKTDVLKDILDYFMRLKTAGLGVPRPIALGEGEGANRATLIYLGKEFDQTISAIQRMFKRTIEKKVFGRLKELGKIKGTPKIIWNEGTPEDLDQKAVRMGIYGKYGFIKPTDEIREAILRVEGLPSGGKPLPQKDAKADQRKFPARAPALKPAAKDSRQDAATGSERKKFFNKKKMTLIGDAKTLLEKAK